MRRPNGDLCGPKVHPALFALCIVLWSFGANSHDFEEFETVVPEEIDATEDRRPSFPGIGAVASGVADLAKVWLPGSNLKVCFFEHDGWDDTQEWKMSLAEEAANEWLEHGANLSFTFRNADGRLSRCGAGDYDIRVSFDEQRHWSKVGTDSLHVRADKPTLNVWLKPFVQYSEAYAPEWKRLFMHEFGHALGVEHEHQSPNSDCVAEMRWDEYIYDYYWLSARWDINKVDFNVRNRISAQRLRTTDYDRFSIMHYQFPQEFFYNGRENRCYTYINFTISETDYAFISSIYPSTPDSLQAQSEFIVHMAEQAGLFALEGLPADFSSQFMDALVNRDADSWREIEAINLMLFRSVCEHPASDCEIVE